MNSYNKLKIQVLIALAESGDKWMKPLEIAKRIDFRPHRSAWTYLKRLCRFGLLERRTSGKGTLEYRISEAGLARLGWLRSSRFL